MQTVGIREFKAQLSRYLHSAAAGNRVVVTDRGRPVAELGPPGVAHRSAYEARVIELGGTLASQPVRLEVEEGHAADWRPLDVAALLDALRGDR